MLVVVVLPVAHLKVVALVPGVTVIAYGTACVMSQAVSIVFTTEARESSAVVVSTVQHSLGMDVASVMTLARRTRIHAPVDMLAMLDTEVQLIKKRVLVNVVRDHDGLPVVLASVKTEHPILSA